MNREIKFKAKIKLNESGLKFHGDKESKFISENIHSVICLEMKLPSIVITDQQNASVITIYKEHCEVYELMQYTGLKDKNGVEIYEGDIVRFNVESRPEVEGEERVTGLIGKVEIGKYCTTFGGWQAVYCSSIIVVGNIHSNPELLK